MNVTTSGRAGRREWAGLAVLTLPCLLYAMDLTVLNLAIPHLSASLRPSGTELLWIVDIYAFMAAGSLVTMGTLGDRIGRRRLLLIGAAAFGATSLLAAWSASPAMLIVARALLGVAGATMAPSTLSLIRNMFGDSRQRTFAISVWITSFSAGGAIGPLLGGLLLEWFWWGSVFLPAVPVMALLLVLGPRLLPEYRDPRPGRLDLASAGLSVAAVLSVIYGLKQITRDGPGWPPAVFIVVGLAAGVVFVRRQHRLADPLLDLRLFRSAAFTAALTTNLLSFFAGFGALLFIAQYLQLVLGLSPLTAGLWMLPASAGTVLGSLLTPVLTRRVRPAFVIAASLTLAAVGLGLFTLLGSAAGLGILVTGSVVFSLAIAPADTLAADLAVGAAPPERSGAASALSETGAELGGALGIAILGLIGTGIYRSQLTGTPPTEILPRTAAAARDTLGGAVAAAARLPGQPARALLQAARQAYTNGLHVTFAVSAAALLGGAVLAAIQLRHLRPESDPEPDPKPGHEPGPPWTQEPANSVDGPVALYRGPLVGGLLVDCQELGVVAVQGQFDARWPGEGRRVWGLEVQDGPAAAGGAFVRVVAAAVGYEPARPGEDLPHLGHLGRRSGSVQREVRLLVTGPLVVGDLGQGRTGPGCQEQL